jgi:hypothetical protein
LVHEEGFLPSKPNACQVRSLGNRLISGGSAPIPVIAVDGGVWRSDV